MANMFCSASHSTNIHCLQTWVKFLLSWVLTSGNLCSRPSPDPGEEAGPPNCACKVLGRCLSLWLEDGVVVELVFHEQVWHSEILDLETQWEGQVTGRAG